MHQASPSSVHVWVMLSVWVASQCSPNFDVISSDSPVPLLSAPPAVCLFTCLSFCLSVVCLYKCLSVCLLNCLSSRVSLCYLQSKAFWHLKNGLLQALCVQMSASPTGYEPLLSGFLCCLRPSVFQCIHPLGKKQTNKNQTSCCNFFLNNITQTWFPVV